MHANYSKDKYINLWTPVANSNGKMNPVESFFCLGKPKYQIVSGNLVKKINLTKNNKFSNIVTRITKIFLYCTLITPFLMLIGKVSYRNKNRFERLPDNEKHYTFRQKFLLDPKMQKTINEADNPKDVKKMIKLKYKDSCFKSLKNEYTEAMIDNTNTLLKKDPTSFDLAWEKLVELDKKHQKKSGFSFLSKFKHWSNINNDEQLKIHLLEEIKKGTCVGLNAITCDSLLNQPDISNEKLKEVLNTKNRQVERILIQLIETTAYQHCLKQDYSFSKIASQHQAVPFQIPNNADFTKHSSLKQITDAIDSFTSLFDPTTSNKKLVAGKIIFLGKPKKDTNNKEFHTSHVCMFQFDLQKGYRVIDQNIGITKYLTKDELADFLKRYYLTVGCFDKATLTIPTKIVP